MWAHCSWCSDIKYIFWVLAFASFYIFCLYACCIRDFIQFAFLFDFWWSSQRIWRRSRRIRLLTIHLIGLSTSIPTIFKHRFTQLPLLLSWIEFMTTLILKLLVRSMLRSTVILMISMQLFVATFLRREFFTIFLYGIFTMSLPSFARCSSSTSDLFFFLFVFLILILFLLLSSSSSPTLVTFPPCSVVLFDRLDEVKIPLLLQHLYVPKFRSLAGVDAFTDSYVFRSLWRGLTLWTLLEC